MATLELRGGPIAYTDRGGAEGREAVVLVHSSGMSGRQWRRLGEELSKTYRVLVPDLLGSGASAAWDDAIPFTLELDAEVVRAMVRLAGGRAHLVGHSYGGLLALLVAEQDPSCALSLAMYEPVVFGVLAPDGPGRREIDAMGAGSALFRDDARGGSEAWWDGFVGYWNGAGAWAALPEPQRAEFLRVGRKVFREVTTLNADGTTRARLTRVDARTLILCGAQTTVAEREVCETLAATLPHATLERVDGAGHMGPLTHADVVNAAIARHLGEAAVQESR